MFKHFYRHRYEMFLMTQFLILFGSLFTLESIYERILLPCLFLVNIAAGVLMVSDRKKIMWLLVAIFLASFLIFGSDLIFYSDEEDSFLLRLLVFFIFYVIVTGQIVRQIWIEEKVDKTVIIGLMSGYIALGFLSFALFMIIETKMPGSFNGYPLESEYSLGLRVDNIMYYAFITLLTIGYGEIIPVTPIAQKASVLVGLTGQFYIVIITAVVVGKYINSFAKRD